MIGMKRLTERQRELLNGMVVGRESNIATFNGPQVDDWKALKTVMVALGGKWKRSTGFEFPDDVDAAEVMRIARDTGIIFDPKEADFYETPANLVEQVCNWAELSKDQLVLEPSAGRGALAVMAKEGYDCIVRCIEPLEENRKALHKHGVTIIRVDSGDFLTVEPIVKYDRVVMNPPFSKRADILHVQYALRFLKPGGVLVAIMSAGIKFRDDRLARDFRALVERHAGEIRDIEDGAFKHAGTMVRTVMVKMRKNAA